MKRLIKTIDDAHGRSPNLMSVNRMKQNILKDESGRSVFTQDTILFFLHFDEQN